MFKVYTADIGLLIEMLGPGTRADILQGNLGGFKGAIFENLMADTLHKKQQSLYYFLKDSGLELDFLVRMKGECVPLEVKAKTAQAKSVKTVLKHADKYHVKHIVKFGDYNVGRKGQLLTLPQLHAIPPGSGAGRNRPRTNRRGRRQRPGKEDPWLICDLQIANSNSNIIENYEKVTPILIFS